MQKPIDLSRQRSTRLLVSGASALALAAISSAAQAQADTEEDASPPPSDERIVVTGSRIQSDGMQAPVPVTVVGSQELEALSPGALINGVSQLPQFLGNETPNSGGAYFTRSGFGTLNLRGLGINRTLTLLNGRRVPASSAFGGVDINLFPESVISSVETTTGGASAAYGSDAVAGVVNFKLDTNFTGLEVNAQVGITSREDGENYELSGAFGTPFAGGRGHFIVAGEYFNHDGIFSYQDRDWYQAVGTFGSGTAADPYRFVPGTVSANASFDGRIFAPGTAIHAMEFNPDGSIGAYNPGSESQFPFGIPPARTAGGNNDNLGAELPTLYPELERISAFAYADYEVSDSLKVFGQYIFGRTELFQYNVIQSSFGGTPTALTIFQDNAFLPSDLRQTMIDNEIDSFILRRRGTLNDVGGNSLDDTFTQHIGTVGFEWDLDTGGVFDGWSVDGFYQYGETTREWGQFGLRVDRIFAAVDAVDDGSGNIVCRTSLFGNAFPGCQPLNLFGEGNASAAAVDYVTGFESGQSISTPLFFADDGFDSGRTYDYTTTDRKLNVTTFEQQFAELSAAGDIADLWAGPIAGAFGVSYRRDEVLQLVQDVTNPPSDHENGHPVLCNGEAPGLRGVSVPDCLNTVGVQYSKVSNIKGSSTVWEGFGEVLLPLYDSDGLGIFANGAVRWADYSGSGSVWAYKGGLELEFGDFRLRGTYSRDVRAANLSERFDRTGGSATITDVRDNSTVTVTIFSGGNPAVNPEEADTYTIGAVYQPSFVPGLSLSLDYYDITIDGAIGQVGTQGIVAGCFNDNVQSFCDLITLNPTTNDIVLVGDVFINIDTATARGLDFEASYNSDINVFGGDEEIDFRLFSAWLFERTETNGGQTFDLAGQTGARQLSQAYEQLPDFRVTASLGYRNGGFSSRIGVRHIGEGIQDVCGLGDNSACPAGQQVVLVDNTVDAVTYVDLRLGYEFDLGNTELEVFGNVTNLFDENPPLTPSYSAFFGYSTQQNPGVYDVLGTRFTLGMRLRM
ncbi:TonB-dependent receptor domain-containing protein [Aurantiacibacter gilvus]|uniref:TonB-dependent receptor n=1 Tax=Aurantiacibacter gilvus TaxID=3139141 RepID=A0ABU9IGC2_9SPHN